MRVGRRSKAPQTRSLMPLATAREPSLQAIVLVCSPPKVLWGGEAWLSLSAAGGTFIPCSSASLRPAEPPGPCQHKHLYAKALNLSEASAAPDGCLQKPELRTGQGGMERPRWGLWLRALESHSFRAHFRHCGGGKRPFLTDSAWKAHGHAQRLARCWLSG